ncbi:hypothetical protein VP1G_04079 [Cytospora mali]|uniref:14-3-3 domain-containing protein n=1 Tax=Cytospora mali TaxID=578113 RepID=A0A194UYY1_CYTMA|nr:hypothetical protein VP1G_04079 [Valsa mali var. pyri (nom. inval.)]
MASSEVDQKFLGRLARKVEQDNPLLSSILFKILGLSINLSEHLVKARKQRKKEPTKTHESLDLHFHILWLGREGLVMLEQYVIPMVGNYNELKVLAYKLRASFYHIFVLFHNNPPVSSQFMSTPSRIDKGKGVARDDGFGSPTLPGIHGRPPYQGGPVAPPPGFGPEPPGAFLLPAVDYLSQTHRYFEDASRLADEHLWGSHTLRLSIKTEYSAFLYECVHDEDASRKLARQTINEVYEATEGIDNEMFGDACQLVAVLGKMMKRGQLSSGKASSAGTTGTQHNTPPRTHSEDVAQQPPPATVAQPGFI